MSNIEDYKKAGFDFETELELREARARAKISFHFGEFRYCLTTEYPDVGDVASESPEITGKVDTFRRGSRKEN